jgi:hypothetical protein
LSIKAPIAAESPVAAVAAVFVVTPGGAANAPNAPVPMSSAAAQPAAARGSDVLGLGTLCKKNEGKIRVEAEGVDILRRDSNNRNFGRSRCARGVIDGVIDGAIDARFPGCFARVFARVCAPPEFPGSSPNLSTIPPR